MSAGKRSSRWLTRNPNHRDCEPWDSVKTIVNRKRHLWTLLEKSNVFYSKLILPIPRISSLPGQRYFALWHLLRIGFAQNFKWNLQIGTFVRYRYDPLAYWDNIDVANSSRFEKHENLNRNIKFEYFNNEIKKCSENRYFIFTLPL